jgi:formylglycine-generating enzyme required for sulfatase activity
MNGKGRLLDDAGSRLAMEPIRYSWNGGGPSNVFDLAFVKGTHGHPYPFGERAGGRSVKIHDFFIGPVPVTQALWTHVLGPAGNPALHQGPDLPVENVSWDEITRPGGFLDRINDSPVLAVLLANLARRRGAFRLPSETEWEYAARGGPHWLDGFRFSGSDDIDAVAWYDRKHGDHTQPVGQKAPNQLGIYDMSGNVWEWCQDVYTPDVGSIPQDGTAFVGPGDERVLRGGCFHNWAVHCTVSKRYQIAHDYHDGCIGLRLVLSVDQQAPDLPGPPARNSTGKGNGDEANS